MIATGRNTYHKLYIVQDSERRILLLPPAEERRKRERYLPQCIFMGSFMLRQGGKKNTFISDLRKSYGSTLCGQTPESI